ncbi:MAG: hypothetical protein ACOY0T_35900 [Myxococcota bacterium]
MPKFHRISALVLLLTAACAGPVPRTAHQVVAAWPVDPKSGIATLAMTYAPEIKVGTSRIASTPQELREVWAYFGFRGAVPNLQFDRRQVIVFVEGGRCSDRGRGRGGQPVIGGWLVDDGSFIPLFEDFETVTCPDGSAERPRTGFAYAVAVPRVAPAPNRVVLGVRPRLSARTFANRLPNAAQSTSALPSPGEAALHTRADGTPVWVVRHRDGSSIALAAEYELAPELVPGLRASLSFRPSKQRFTGPFDAWGTHLSGVQPGLERFAFRVRDGKIEIGESLGRVPAGRPHLELRSRASVESVISTRGAFDHVPRRSVRAALSEAPGTLSIVRGRMQLKPNADALLCESDATSHDDCAVVRDLRPAPGCEGYLSGDFAVRSNGVGFERLVELSKDTELACRTEEGVRPWWEPGGAWGVRPFSAAARLGAYTGLAGTEPQVGGELSAALRFRHTWPAARSFWQAQLGDVFEVGLRARWFDEPRQHGIPAWALGVSPLLSARPPFSKWSTTTLLGIVVPELGFIARNDVYRAYLAWRLPVEYRASPLRQRPYDANERLAWFLAPEFMLSLGDSTRPWRAGVAGGLVVW